MKQVIFTVLLVTALLLGQTPAHGQGRGGGSGGGSGGGGGGSRDNKAPSIPGSLRVTGVTAWRVSLAWNASTDNSGQLSYRVLSSNGATMTVPQTQTAAVFSSGLQNGSTYTFRVVAFDAAGNQSTASNAVTVTLATDTTAPSKPTVSVTGTGPTHIGLAWSSTDDDQFLGYEVLLDGQPTLFGPFRTMPVGTLYFLAPSTTYTITVRARDRAMNWSVPSDPLVVTTPPSDPNDTVAPTSPSNFSAYDFCGDFIIMWQQSTDNVTPDEFVHYEVFVNGVLDHRTVNEDTLVSVMPGALNRIDVVAVDERGNRSSAGTIFIDLRI